MLATLSPRRVAPSATPFPPGRLFNAEDFVLADLQTYEMWDRMVTIAVREQASDIHLTSQADGVHVALRLDGKLANQGMLPADAGIRLGNHVKVMAQLDVSERRRPQDGRVTVEVDGRAIDLRMAILPTAHGEDVAVRILDRETGLLDVDRLGIAPCQQGDFASLINAPSGLVLVSGSTGAGKTTTLYAILRKLADGSRKIVTAENPIEFDLPGVNQSQVNHKIGVDYATLLRGILRQDPNVIMIGEIRDAETADAVVRAANSGRLVFATTHAVSSAAAIESLTGLGAHPHFVARSFRGVIAQTLVRRLCQYCTLPLVETYDVEILADARRFLSPHESPALSMGRGCPHCRHTGYRSRLGVFEILTADDTVRAHIAQRSTAREIYDYALSRGMITMGQAGKIAVLRGQTTIEELLIHVPELSRDPR